MNKKIICLTIIAMFVLSILTMSFTAEAQTLNPTKVTQEIDPETAPPLFSDLTNIASVQSVSGITDITITAKGRPTPASQPKYALTVEIDYMEGHQPTQSVLDYMKNYYSARGITITYDIPATATVPLDDSVSETEFWALEAVYNDGPDIAVDDDVYTEYIIPYKWVLFGTTVESNPNVVGFTYCVGNTFDLVAGNYIYIADKAADDWAGTNAKLMMGAEAVVLMHEFGHSIGICVVQNGAEIYCLNSNCAMSYLNIRNAGKTNQWSYCNTHWSTKNLGYYVA